ncbi:chemotaxis protein CheX [Dactylosporangium sp. AC04546]|uniref:chemotaxis protein CheX n=1 Tax=Dactylosporangium sp. AC04546 TaxID=2862460 RepID=UPI001EDEEB9F|nr:chemotaxis protein CheX [Dactylosporangium sp. AC04546]WVK86102.1 chemotaxis protein CheX [Dactylosporangium sp. AC04546]
MTDALTQADSAPTESGLDDQDLVEIVNEVWNAYLQQPDAEPVDEADSPDPRTITAAVSITGAWEGHVRVLVPPSAAGDITAIMLAMEPGEVTDQDVTDAMGELVNVVGGNIKNRGAQPAKLGLPVVATGKMLFPATRETHRLAVAWRGATPIAFSVLHVNPDRPVIIAPKAVR